MAKEDWMSHSDGCRCAPDGLRTSSKRLWFWEARRSMDASGTPSSAIYRESSFLWTMTVLMHFSHKNKNTTCSSPQGTREKHKSTKTQMKLTIILCIFDFEPYRRFQNQHWGVCSDLDDHDWIQRSWCDGTVQNLLHPRWRHERRESHYAPQHCGNLGRPLWHRYTKAKAKEKVGRDTLKQKLKFVQKSMVFEFAMGEHINQRIHVPWRILIFTWKFFLQTLKADNWARKVSLLLGPTSWVHWV